MPSRPIHPPVDPREVGESHEAPDTSAEPGDVGDGHGRLPLFFAGLLLLLASSSSPVVAAGGGIGALVVVGVRRSLGSVTWKTVVVGALAGGIVAAFFQGTELRPPADAVAATLAMLRHVLLAGVVFGGILVGGGLTLVLKALPSQGILGDSGGSREPTGMRAVVGKALRPFRLVALLFVLAYAPILASQLRGGATEGRIEMIEELRRIGYHQESYFQARGHFAEDLRELRDYVPIMEGRVEISSAGGREWTAAAQHRLLTTVCQASGLAPADGVPLEPGRPECADNRRWYPGEGLLPGLATRWAGGPEEAP